MDAYIVWYKTMLQVKTVVIITILLVNKIQMVTSKILIYLEEYNSLSCGITMLPNALFSIFVMVITQNNPNYE